MNNAYEAPGVYREGVFLKPQVGLPTGVPGFIGFFNRQDLEDAEPSVGIPIRLHRREEFTDRFISALEPASEAVEVGYLGAAINGFFANGGSRCYVVRADPTISKEAALIQAIDALALLSDLDLVAVPDAMTLADPDAILRIQQAVLTHCATIGDRLAILDVFPEQLLHRIVAELQQRNPSAVVTLEDAIRTQRERIGANQQEPISATLYYPWVHNAAGRWVPPCGHIAGIFARSDSAQGVFKAPANEVIRDAFDLERSLDDATQAQLNPEGINCLRVFPGRGIRVWGARTLSRRPNWRYVNIRRLFLTVGRRIELTLLDTTFEPNSPQLWTRIQREVSTYLTQLWQAGALQGATAEQAFYVKCDAETNPPEVREAGQVITELGLAAAAPAEFIIARIIQHAGNTEISV
jgi:hypothetical protein